MPASTAEDHLRHTWALLHSDDGVVEVRVLNVPEGHGGKWKSTHAGYFNDAAKFSEACWHLSGRAPAVYATLNPCEPALFARAANRLERRPKSTASDQDIVRRRWLPVDLDPKRPSGVSSTNEEHRAAIERARTIRDWLRDERGWPDPVAADSGNGCHLLYRIDLPNDVPARDLVHQCLQALAARFGDAAVDVDLTTHNAARIWKVYGTMACKGDSTADRPHRWAHVMQIPDSGGGGPQIVPRDLLAGLAGEAPKAEEASPSSSGHRPGLRVAGGAGSFDARRWMSDHGVVIRSEKPWAEGGTVFIVDCPWGGPSHGDAHVTLKSSGVTGFRCFHNSCDGRNWKAFREHHEPGCYDHPTGGRSKYQDPDFNLDAEVVEVIALAEQDQIKAIDRFSSNIAPALSCMSAAKADAYAGQMAKPLGVPKGALKATVREQRGKPHLRVIDGGGQGSSGDPDLPSIMVTDRQMRIIMADGWAATLPEPTLFLHSGSLVRFQGGHLRPLNKDGLRSLLAKRANWDRVIDGGDKVAGRVPGDLAGMMCADPHPGVREIEDVLSVPTLGRDGRLLQEPGYHADSKCYLDLAPCLNGLQIPDSPTIEQVTQAVSLIRNDWLGDFPFENESDEATALALGLLPFVRQYINDLAPMHLFEAPSEGTGKSLLVELLADVAVEPSMMGHLSAAQGDESEIRKSITTARSYGQWYLILDNEAGYLKSSELAKAVTQSHRTDRILGGNTQFSGSMRGIAWVISANNLETSREILRRIVPCRMDSDVVRPWERSGFKHKNIKRWTVNNRWRLVEAFLIIVQGWVAGGRPEEPGARIGSFERWGAIMGGLLAYMDVKQFLGGMDALRERAHVDENDGATFCRIWWAEYRREDVQVKDLGWLASDKGALAGAIGAKEGLARAQRMGHWLRRHMGRVFDLGEDVGLRVKILLGPRAQGVQRYRLVDKARDAGGNSE